jgi:hypothetical protein
MRGYRIGFAAVALALSLGLVLSPVSASAKRKHKKRQGVVQVITATASTSVTAAAVPEATATCPAGTTAIGGGINLPLPADSLWSPLDSERVGSSQWRASGSAIPGTGSTLTLTVEVYCAKLRGVVTDVPAVNTATTPASPDVSSIAACPQGTQLLSGGFSEQTPPSSGGAVSYRSAPAGNGWSASYKRSGPSGSSTVTTTAYCFTPAKQKQKKGKKAGVAKKRKPRFQNPRPLQVIAANAAFTTTTQATTSFFTTPCPGKRRIISGGFSGPQPTTATSASFNAAHIAPVVWNVSAQQFADPPASPSTITAYADCA